jgi:hypothetical protein
LTLQILRRLHFPWRIHQGRGPQFRNPGWVSNPYSGSNVVCKLAILYCILDVQVSDLDPEMAMLVFRGFSQPLETWVVISWTSSLRINS